MKPSEHEQLTEHEREMADVLVEACGLEKYSEVELNMMGQRGTVHYGLGRCFKHMIAKNPDLMESPETPGIIRDMIMTQLEQQGLLGA